MLRSDLDLSDNDDFSACCAEGLSQERFLESTNGVSMEESATLASPVAAPNDGEGNMNTPHFSCQPTCRTAGGRKVLAQAQCKARWLQGRC